MGSEYAVLFGLGAGRGGRRAGARSRDGNGLFDEPLPQDETPLRDLSMGLQGAGVLMAVDQLSAISVLAVAVARPASGVDHGRLAVLQGYEKGRHGVARHVGAFGGARADSPECRPSAQ